MSPNKEDKKILTVKVLVSIIGILILVIWIFNFKNEFRRDKERESNKNQEALLKLRTDFNKTINSIQKSIEENNKSGVKLNSSSTKFLLNLVKNAQTEKKAGINFSNNFKSASSSLLVASSSTIIPESNKSASSDPLFIKKNGNCPQYINCMPTLDAPARSCQIPPGCEKITTLVY